MSNIPSRKKPPADNNNTSGAKPPVVGGLPSRKKPVSDASQPIENATKNAGRLAETKRKLLLDDVKVDRPKKKVDPTAAKNTAPKNTSTDLVTTETLPWPDWTNPERNSVRAIMLSPYMSRAQYRPWWERHDLWWTDELFAGGNPMWLKPGKYVWTTTTSVTGSLSRRRVHIPEYTGEASTRSPHVRNIISALINWHHATARQLSAICNHHPTNFSGRILKPLFDAGLIERGRFLTSAAGSNMKNDYCYRLRVDEPLWRWLDHFDDETWVNITYGELPTEPSAHVRHNLLAFETALRVMESVPNITAVYGEHITSMRKLLGTDNRQRGDIGVVRGDGMRIIIEVVHEQYKEGFSKKIASWAHQLTKNGTVNQHGTIVVFLAAPKRYNEAIGEMRRRFQDALTPDGLRSSSGVAADPNTVANARLHIFMATWPDWFPGPHLLSDEFNKLTAWKLSPTNDWQAVNLSETKGPNSYPFKPDDPLKWMMPAEVHSRLYAQPTWMMQPKNNIRDPLELLQIPIQLGDIKKQKR